MGLMITPASKAAHVFLVNEGRARTGGRESPQKQVGVVQLAWLVAARRGTHRQQHHRITGTEAGRHTAVRSVSRPRHHINVDASPAAEQCHVAPD